MKQSKITAEAGEGISGGMPVIPYFIFRNTALENCLLLQVYTDNAQLADLHFQIEETHVSIFSSKFSDGECLAKVRLPVKVSKSVSKQQYFSSTCHYKLFLHKLKCDNSDERNSSIKLDVISPYLSWNCDFQEKAYSLTNDEQQFEDEITASLQKKLTFEDSVSKSCDTNKPIIGSYGFASRYQDVLKHVKGNWRNVIDDENPNLSTSEIRYLARWENERQAFDIDHYLADYFFENTDDTSDSEFSLLNYISYCPYWHKIETADEKILNSKQMLILAKLPCKNFKLSANERIEALHSLFDIILAYCYDYRVNAGTHNSESAWNIYKLSSTLSWLEVHGNLRDVILSFYRRCLTFPLVRHWLLGRKVLDDALAVFYLGRRQLLNCLISIFELFDDCDDRQIFNTLYIEDYLIWIQQVHPLTIKNYAKLIESEKPVLRKDVFSTLPVIESTAIEMLRAEDEFQYEEWGRKVKQLTAFMNNNSGRSNDSESSVSGSE